MRYLIKLKPIEPYFLGGEVTFKFGETKQQVRSKYYIRSQELPSQSTLLGMVRYVILEKTGHLNSNFDYRDKKEKLEELIGKNSFKIEQTQSQDFGKIKRLSPLFLMNSNNEKYVVTPFNHKSGNEKYQPFNFEQTDKKTDKKIETNFGSISMLTDYSPKDGIEESLNNLKNLDILKKDSDVKDKKKWAFKRVTKVGIRKKDINENGNKEGFFKKEYCMLHDEYAFAFYLDMEDKDCIPKETIVYLGQGKSAFKFISEEIEETVQLKCATVLNKECRRSFAEKNKKTEYLVYYALSDIFTSKKILDCCEYTILKTKHFRGLETDFSGKNYIDKVKKNNNLKNLISAGSVFYVDPNNRDEFERCCKDLSGNCKKIGLNQIVEL